MGLDIQCHFGVLMGLKRNVHGSHLKAMPEPGFHHQSQLFSSKQLLNQYCLPDNE